MNNQKKKRELIKQFPILKGKLLNVIEWLHEGEVYTYKGLPLRDQFKAALKKTGNYPDGMIPHYSGGIPEYLDHPILIDKWSDSERKAIRMELKEIRDLLGETKLNRNKIIQLSTLSLDLCAELPLSNFLKRQTEKIYRTVDTNGSYLKWKPIKRTMFVLSEVVPFVKEISIEIVDMYQ